jgi:hypothetical protein
MCSSSPGVTVAVTLQLLERQSPPHRQSLTPAPTRGLGNKSENLRHSFVGPVTDMAPPSPLAVEELGGRARLGLDVKISSTCKGRSSKETSRDFVAATLGRSSRCNWRYRVCSLECLEHIAAPRRGSIRAYPPRRASSLTARSPGIGPGRVGA